MTDLHKRLAKKLDDMPQGYPSTGSGIEVKILEKIFSSEDAEIALQLRPIPETAENIAKRLGKSVEETVTTLDAMAEKGQIGSQTKGGRQFYMLAPFLPGIYEFQVYRLTKELSQMFEEYFPTLMKTVGGYEPGVMRTIPVSSKIDNLSKVERYEDVRKMVEEAVSFRIIDCICRKERALLGHACEHTVENCLSISTEENAFDYFSIGGRVVTKEEALKVLDKAEEEGLIHNAFCNTKEGHAAICNCCSCCCGIFRGHNEYGIKNAIAKSNFIAVIDPDACTECGICKDERCPVGAIEDTQGAYVVKTDDCIGCGVCTVTCPTEAITLVKKPESEQNQPAENMMDWIVKRATDRGIELKLD